MILTFPIDSLLNLSVQSTGIEPVCSRTKTLSFMLATYSDVQTEPENLSISSPSRVAVPRRLDEITGTSFFRRCQSYIQQNQQAWLILDFCETEFVDSCGIGALIQLGKLAWEHKFRIIAWSIKPDIESLLKDTGCDLFIQIDSRMKALHEDNSTDSALPVAHTSVNSAVKRAIDIVGGMVGLIITALIFIPIAIAIKLDSPGPVLFSQTRLGYLGQPIRIWKFRSMVENAESLKSEVTNDIEGAFFKSHQDPRVTRVGRFLRRTSLDEFPQFWCVFQGNMSLVGTRPPTLDEVAQYEVSDWRRLNVKAGLTGQWQVSGRSKVVSFNEVVALDREYQSRWSVLHDFNLILETVATVFTHRAGAV